MNELILYEKAFILFLKDRGIFIRCRAVKSVLNRKLRLSKNYLTAMDITVYYCLVKYVTSLIIKSKFNN